MLSSFSYSFICNIANLKIFAYLWSAIINKSFISQNLKVAGPSGGKFGFLVSRDLKFKAFFITETQK